MEQVASGKWRGQLRKGSPVYEFTKFLLLSVGLRVSLIIKKKKKRGGGMEKNKRRKLTVLCFFS